MFLKNLVLSWKILRIDYYFFRHQIINLYFEQKKIEKLKGKNMSGISSKMLKNLLSDMEFNEHVLFPSDLVLDTVSEKST